MSSITRPLQKLPDSKKDSSWRIDSVNHYAQICAFPNQYIWNLYKAANGDLDYLEYNYITNPYGKAVNNRPNLRNFPAKLRNYPIIPQLINLLMGEKRKRPIIANVKVNNNDVPTKKKEAEMEVLRKYAYQSYINELNALGVDTSQPSRELENLDVVMKEFDRTWNDQRAILGSRILDFIRDDCQLDQKFIIGFFDWLVTASVFSYRDAIRDDVTYQRLSPKNVGYLLDETIDYIEDGEAAAVRLEMTASEVLDRFYDGSLEDNESLDNMIDYLDKIAGSGTSNVSERKLLMNDTDTGTFYSNTRNTPNDYNGNLNSRFNLQANSVVEVIYVNWKSWTRIKQISILNPIGIEEIVEVPFDYKVDTENGEKLIDSYWINQVWEGYKIANQFYLNIRPIPHQRGTINNPSKCKLLINGRVKRSGDVKGLSIVEYLMPFQHLYNFGHYKLNLTLAKNKDKLLLLPLDILPKEEGWDMYTSMYYADSTGILWIDGSDSQVVNAANLIKSIDMSLNNYIDFMYKYLNNVKQEAEELVGITRQRKGAVNSSDGLGATQVANFQSSLITEDLFAQYDEFQEKEFNALLDLSKYAYRKGKRASYVSSDGRTMMLDVDIENIDIQEVQFGVRVVSNVREQNKFETLKEYAHAFAQNDAKPSTVAKILNASGSFAELEAKLEEIEKLENEIAASNAEAEKQHALELQQMMISDKQADRDLKKYEIDTKASTDIEKALIGASAFPDGSEIDVTGLDVNTIEANRIKREELGLKFSLENKKINQKDKEINTKSKLEREKMANDLKIAKENKTKAELSKK